MCKSIRETGVYQDEDGDGMRNRSFPFPPFSVSLWNAVLLFLLLLYLSSVLFRRMKKEQEGEEEVVEAEEARKEALEGLPFSFTRIPPPPPPLSPFLLIQPPLPRLALGEAARRSPSTLAVRTRPSVAGGRGGLP